jgi:hypothetical protein
MVNYRGETLASYLAGLSYKEAEKVKQADNKSFTEEKVVANLPKVQ